MSEELSQSRLTMSERQQTILMAGIVEDWNERAKYVDPIKLNLLQITLSTAVPIGIANVRESYGKPQNYHREAILKRLQATRADGKIQSGFADMLFGGPQGADEMALLCDIIAVLAFQPGGVKAFGLHFEVQPDSLGSESDADHDDNH